MSRRNLIDCTFLTGLTLVAAGVGCWSIPASMVVTGTVLVVCAVIGVCLPC